METHTTSDSDLPWVKCYVCTFKSNFKSIVVFAAVWKAAIFCCQSVCAAGWKATGAVVIHAAVCSDIAGGAATSEPGRVCFLWHWH